MLDEPKTHLLRLCTYKKKISVAKCRNYVSRKVILNGKEIAPSLREYTLVSHLKASVSAVLQITWDLKSL